MAALSVTRVQYKIPELLLRCVNSLYQHSRHSEAEGAYVARQMHYTDHETDFVSSACVMVRRAKVITGNLFFDKDFFLYSEDVEWSYKFHQAGYRNSLFAGLEVYHVNSASTGWSAAKAAQMQISGYLYYLKPHTALSYLLFGLVSWLNHKMDINLVGRAGQVEGMRQEQAQMDVLSSIFYLF